MEIAKLILSYLDVLIWPVILGCIAYTFRKEIIKLSTRLVEAKLPGGIDLSFSEELKEAKILSEEAAQAPPRLESKGRPTITLTEANKRMLELGLQPSPSGLDFNYYRNLAKDDPNLALAGLRMELEVMGRNLANGFKIKIGKRMGIGKLIDVLFQNGAITPDQEGLIRSILELCNKAIHGVSVSYKEAIDVISTAEVLREDYIRWLSWGFDNEWKIPDVENNNHV